ncbi:MAG: hypothetical protein N2037_06010 [Acidimicrobiales bacterium]|nr:hypothetical protein [Acidimicrobiales bacterium]
MNRYPARLITNRYSGRSRHRLARSATLGVVLVMSAAACGGGGSKTTTVARGESSTSVASNASSTMVDSAGAGAASDDGSFAGSATLSFGGRTETFRIEPCVSSTARSIQGAGKTADGRWSLLLQVNDGSGEVSVSDATDNMAVVFDGKAEELTVSASGSFRGSGTGVFENAQSQFELTGTCGTLTWR